MSDEKNNEELEEEMRRESKWQNSPHTEYVIKKKDGSRIWFDQKCENCTWCIDEYHNSRVTLRNCFLYGFRTWSCCWCSKWEKDWTTRLKEWFGRRTWTTRVKEWLERREWFTNLITLYKESETLQALVGMMELLGLIVLMLGFFFAIGYGCSSTIMNSVP